MLTVEKLREYGANVDEGLERCMNNAEFYLNLVNMVIPDGRIEELDAAINSGDFDTAFEISHALKGMYANLALTPLSNPVTECCELLRAKTQTDYSALMIEIKKQKQLLDELSK